MIDGSQQQNRGSSAVSTSVDDHRSAPRLPQSRMMNTLLWKVTAPKIAELSLADDGSAFLKSQSFYSDSAVDPGNMLRSSSRGKVVA
jgi:hypothetical protein